MNDEAPGEKRGISPLLDSVVENGNSRSRVWTNARGDRLKKENMKQRSRAGASGGSGGSGGSMGERDPSERNLHGGGSGGGLNRGGRGAVTMRNMKERASSARES